MDTTNSPKPLAYSYQRFSSVRQEENDSIRRQKSLAEVIAEEKQLQLVDTEEYSFLDRAKSGYSGANFTDDDSQLRRFYELVKSGTIPQGSYLIVESLDRLSRQHPKTALPRFIDLLNAGINVVTGMDRRVYTGEVSDLDLIVSIMEMSRSYRESKYKSERVGAKWREKQKAAEGGTPMGATRPGWLDPVYRPEDKDNPKKKPTHYVVNEVKKQIVKDIFQWTIDGYGREAIAKKLNEAGIPSFKGGTWGGSSVAQIVKSPTVLGLYQPYMGKGKDRVKMGEPIKGLYEPIIDEQTFYAANQAMTARHRERVTKHPPFYNVWSKLLICQKCHAAVNLYSKGKDKRRYLQCYEARKRVCKAKAIRVERAEEAFKQLLTKVNSLSLVRSDARSLDAQLNEVLGRLNEQQAILAGHLDFLRTNRSSAIQGLVVECEANIGQLQQRKDELEQSLAMDRITNKEDFFARLDLESYEGRARANQLLKRLGIIVTAFRTDDSVEYMVYRKELKTLKMLHADGDEEIQVTPYSGEVAEIQLRQGEITEDGLYISPGFNRRLKKLGTVESVTTPSTDGPNWNSLEEPLYEQDYEDEYTVPGE
jgi:DNA invertase Pin-like site-specific DNA recombinase